MDEDRWAVMVRRVLGLKSPSSAVPVARENSAGTVLSRRAGVVGSPSTHSIHLSNEERLKVHSHCLSELRRFVEKGGPVPGTKEVGEFRDYLIVALMMSNPLRSEDLYKAERCHVLQPGSPANELQTSWVIRLPPELLKREKDVKWIVVHESLRAGWELYWNEVLPAVKKVKGHHEHLFFHATGTHITDFGDNIGWITQTVVGRRINPHKTRKTLATSLRNMASTTEMDMAAFAKTAHHSRRHRRDTMWKADWRTS